jgi:hypothetical protein
MWRSRTSAAVQRGLFVGSPGRGATAPRSISLWDGEQRRSLCTKIRLGADSRFPPSSSLLNICSWRRPTSAARLGHATRSYGRIAESGQRGESQAQSVVEETDDDNDEDEGDSEWDSEDEDVEDDDVQKSGKPNVAAANSRPRKQDTEWLPPRTLPVCAVSVCRVCVHVCACADRCMCV